MISVNSYLRWKFVTGLTMEVNVPTMTDDRLQRFAIVLMLFGGFLDLHGAIEGNYLGVYGAGQIIMLLALIISIVPMLVKE